MNKKCNILTYIIFSFIICFLFEPSIKAQVCSYKSFVNPFYETSEYFSIMNEVGKINNTNKLSESFLKNINSNFTIFYSPYGVNKMTSATVKLDHPYTINNYDVRIYEISFSFNTDEKKGEFKVLFPYSTQNDTFIVTIGKDVESGGKKYKQHSTSFGVEQYNLNSLIDETLTNGKCPDFILASVYIPPVENVFESSSLNFETGTASNNSDYLSKMLRASSESNEDSIVLFSNTINKEYYIGKVCQVKNYDKNLNIINDIDAIFKKFDESGFNYKRFYSNYEEQLKSGKSAEEILSGDVSNVLISEIVKLPYFEEYNYNADKIIQAMAKDYNVLAQYQNTVNLCFMEKFGLSTKQWVYDWYNTYDKESNYKYADLTAQLLQNIKEEIKKSDYLDTLIALKYETAIKESTSSCSKVPTSEERACRISACHQSLNYVNCDDLFSKTLEDLNSNISKGIYQYSINECKEATNNSYQYSECLIGTCNNLINTIKNDKENGCGEIMDGTTDASEATKEIIKQTTYSTIRTTGINIDGDKDKICEILYSEDGLGIYIFGLLNLIRIGGPILIIILTAFDAIKLMASFKDDENKKFFNRLKIRLICLALLLIIPTIIIFLINLFFDGMCTTYLTNK